MVSLFAGATKTATLVSAIFRLEVLKAGGVPAWHGDIMRGAFYHLIHTHDAAYASALHDANQRKPFTTSLLRAGSRCRDGSLHFGRDEFVEWRVTLLDGELFMKLCGALRMAELQIGAVRFRVRDVWVNPKHHRDSCFTTTTDLARRWEEQAAPEACRRGVTLCFDSPTVFKYSGEWHYLPDSRAVFGGLMQRWLEVTGAEKSEALQNFRQWTATSIAVKPARLEITEGAPNGYTAPAFIGKLLYRPVSLARPDAVDDEHERRLLHLLTDLAFYTGVGYGTGAGMGQVRGEH